MVARKGKSLTVKGIPERLLAWLRKRAVAHHRSINGEVLEILQGIADGEQSARATVDLGGASLIAEGRHHDLDALAGTWTAKEAAEFEANTAHFGEIDEGLWR